MITFNPDSIKTSPNNLAKSRFSQPISRPQAEANPSVSNKAASPVTWQPNQRSGERPSWATANRKPKEVIDEIEATLRALMVEGQVSELRIMYPPTNGHSGVVHVFFDWSQIGEVAEYVVESSDGAKAVYFIFNPVNPAKLEEQDKEFETGVRPTCTKDVDIVRRDWLLIDVDSARGVPDSSATDEEKAESLKTVQKVRAFLDEKGWPEPVFADSGNGNHLLYPIQLPADDNGLVTRVLRALAQRFDTPGAKIDTTVGNSARLTKLYGTKVRKGKESAERPHRKSQLLAVPAKIECVSRELLEALASEAPEPRPASPSVSPAPIASLSEDRERIIQRARAYLAQIPPAISGQHGDDRTFYAACRLMKGFGLLIEEALPLLKEWNRTCQPPWEEARLMRNLERAKIQDGETGYLLRDLHATGLEAEDDPHRLARVVLEKEYSHDLGCTLRYWEGDWYEWDGAAYQETSTNELRAKVCRVIKQDFDRLYSKPQPVADGDQKNPPEKARKCPKVTRNIVDNVLQALASLTLVPGKLKPPAWLKNEEPLAASEFVAAKNALVHVPSVLEGDNAFFPPTPEYFTTTALEYELSKDASEPREWLTFLDQLWPDDPQSIATLQDWFGYCLLPDTSQQKILFILGPKRSGKGTIARVLAGVLGEKNVAGPTLSSLAGTFGLWPLLGKPLAMISDARLSGKADQAFIVERLLSISGEDAVTVDRKNRTSVTTTLPTRLIVLSNELPRLADASGALASRLIILGLTRTWYGTENPALTSTLLKERQDIFWWAVAGLKRLRQRGKFEQPDRH